MTTITLDDEITAGRNTREPLGRGEVSIDSEIAHALGIRVGDQIVMSIVGREFTLSVVQLRRTTRNGVKPFFFFQLSAEQFVDAPRSYFTLSTISADYRADTMKTIVQSVGQHLSFIEIDAIITQIQEILQAIAWSIIIVFSSVLLCGMIIFLLCMRFVTEEHESDARLLHLL